MRKQMKWLICFAYWPLLLSIKCANQMSAYLSFIVVVVHKNSIGWNGLCAVESTFDSLSHVKFSSSSIFQLFWKHLNALKKNDDHDRNDNNNWQKAFNYSAFVRKTHAGNAPSESFWVVNKWMRIHELPADRSMYFRWKCATKLRISNELHNSFS